MQEKKGGRESEEEGRKRGKRKEREREAEEEKSRRGGIRDERAPLEQKTMHVLRISRFS